MPCATRSPCVPSQVLLPANIGAAGATANATSSATAGRKLLLA